MSRAETHTNIPSGIALRIFNLGLDLQASGLAVKCKVPSRIHEGVVIPVVGAVSISGYDMYRFGIKIHSDETTAQSLVSLTPLSREGYEYPRVGVPVYNPKPDFAKPNEKIESRTGYLALHARVSITNPSSSDFVLIGEAADPRQTEELVYGAKEAQSFLTAIRSAAEDKLMIHTSVQRATSSVVAA